jgi:hypothetical protein
VFKYIVVFTTLLNQVESCGRLGFHHSPHELDDILTYSVFRVFMEKLEHFISSVSQRFCPQKTSFVDFILTGMGRFGD